MSNHSPRRRKAIVHIGMHKTGTTAIQVFATSNQAALRQAGLYWPDEFPAGAEYVGAHHYIAWGLQGQQDTLARYGYGADFIAATRQRLQRRPEADLLLSTENFDDLDAGQIAALATLLEGFDVHIVLYLRRQDDFLQAMYQTEVVHFGRTSTITDSLDDPRLDYYALVRRWADRFGKDKVSVRVYEPGQLVQDNSVVDFLSVLRQLGHEVVAPIPQGRKNTGMPSGYVELVRRMAAGGQPGNDLWLRARPVGKQLYADSQGEYWFLSPSQRRALLERYRESNARLAAEFLGRPDGRLFARLDVSWDDAGWKQAFGSTDTLFNAFLDDVVRALQARRQAPAPAAPSFGALPSHLRFY